jgi:hypothetical protein
MRLRLVALIVIGSLASATGAAISGNTTDPAPRAAFALLRLQAVPAWAELRCRRSGVRLCPSALPRPFLGPLLSTGENGHPPALQVQTKTYLDRGGRFAWVSFSYGGDWEPDSGPDWRQHLWRNRPCCFLHFEVYRRLSGPPVISENGKPAAIGGRRGYLAQAVGSGTSCGPPNGNGDHAAYWCNHLRFVWKQNGTWYAAGLHSFGRGTRDLLAQLVRDLS